MEKNDILKQYRDNNEDEGKLFAASRGRKFGVIAMIVTFVFYSIYNLYNGKITEMYPLLSIFFFYLSAESLGIYLFTRKKIEIIKISVGVIIAVFSLYKYIL